MKEKTDKNGRVAKKTDCWYCEGTKLHWGVSCPACNGTGKELVRKQMQKVYNATQGLNVRSNLNIE